MILLPLHVPAAHLLPGLRVRRLDTGDLLYEVESVAREQVFNPEAGEVLTYVRADCRHTDGTLRPHYWLPDDIVTVHTT